MKIEQILSGIFQIAGDAPELNMSNYSEDEVERLNDAMIEIYNLAKQAYDTRTESEPSINYDGLLAPSYDRADMQDAFNAGGIGESWENWIKEYDSPI